MLKQLFHKIFNETLKNASKLLVGTIIAQFIPLVFSFVLSRIYDDAAFGFYGLYTSTISILIVVINLKYETTIVLPKEHKDANALVGISLFWAFVLSLILLFVLFAYRLNMLYFVAWNNSYNWLFFVPISVFVFGSYQAFNYWLIRHKKYSESSYNKVAQRVAETPLNLLLGKFNFVFGLIIGDVFGRVVMTFQAIYQSVKNGFSLKGISLEEYKKMLKRYRSFALINSLPSLANTIATHAPLFIVNMFYGIEIAGQLTLVRTVLSIPVSLVSSNISQVIFQQVSERVSNNNEFMTVLRNVFYLLLSLSVLMAILFIPFGQYIFQLYGSKWSLAGYMSQILVISFSVKFLISSFSTILLSLEKIKQISVWQISYMLLVFVLYLVVKKYDLSINNFLIAYLIVDLFSYLIYAVIIYKAISEYHFSLKNQI